MGPKAILCPLLLIALIACPSITMALNYNIVDRICIPDAVAVPPIVKRAPIPVGCQLVDCCPGCPGPGPLEWRINVDAKVLDGAELRFEGLTAGDLMRLKVRGSAKRVGDRILLRRGKSTISGVPETVGGKATVGSLLPLMSNDAAARLRSLPSGSQTRPGSPGSSSIRDDITVQQFLGSFQVNDFRWRHLIRPCIGPTQPPMALQDRLKIQGISGGGHVVVMIDSRTNPGAGGCSNDEVLRSTDPISPTGKTVLALGNRRSSVTCNSEIAIFSENNAMYFETPVTRWTDNPGDLHTVTLQPIINLPVTVWIANSAAEAQATDDINKANALYKKNKVGIQFDAKFKPVWTISEAVNKINNGINSIPECTNIRSVQESVYYIADSLNVYYVDVGMGGRNCALKKTPESDDCTCAGVEKGDGNITYIGTWANVTTLAHELGHALGLRPGPCGGHTFKEGGGYLPGFGPDNIMADGEERDSFSVGQVFRMNTHKGVAPDMCGGTMLIENNPPLRPGRACPPLTTSTICPALSTDWP